MKERTRIPMWGRWVAGPPLVMLVVCLMPQRAGAIRISGRTSMETVSYGERISSLTGSTTALKLYATIQPWEGHNSVLVVDAERRYHGQNTELDGYRCRSLYLRTILRSVELSLGRQYLLEAPGTTMDGVRLRWKLDRRFSAGLFGGLKADPYRRGITTHYTIFGLFGSFARERLDATAGYVSEFFRGTFNRSYVDLQASYRYGRIFRIYGKSTIDTDDSQMPSYLTRLYIRSHLSPWEKLRFSLLYSRYQAYQEFAFPDYAYLSAFFPTHRFSVGADGRVTEHMRLSFNGGFNYRTSNETRTPFGSVTLNARGIVQKNLTSYARLYRSWGDLYRSTVTTLGISQGLGGGNFLRLSISYRSNASGFGGADAKGWFASGSVRAVLADHLLFNLTYNYDYWDSFEQNGLYASVGYRF